MKNYDDVMKLKPEYIGSDRLCNICGYRFAKFAPYGSKPREAQCPVCGSLERHRHLYIHLLQIYPFLKGKRVLHFAPEKIIKELFLSSEAMYYDADLQPGRASYEADITNIPFENNFFDYVVAIHVLEHIPDDIKAMQELNRVLKPGGIAFLSVPIKSEHIEDLSVTDPKEREKLFGQHDHVRIYNLPVFLDRLKIALFNVDLLSSSNKFPQFLNSAKLGDNIVLAKKTM